MRKIKNPGLITVGMGLVFQKEAMMSLYPGSVL